MTNAPLEREETIGPSSMPFAPPHNVVFAGGGGRCVWQIGFWHAVAPTLQLQPQCVTAVSAGAAMAACLLSGREDAAMDAFFSRMQHNPKNFYPEYLFKSEKKAFPQSTIYREAMLEAIDREAWLALQDAPPLYILLATPPWYLGPRSGALFGLTCYRLEKTIRHPLHPTWCKGLGFTPWVVKAQDCPDRESLISLILQSSCTPPFTPLYRRDGYPVLDGGLVDNVPVVAIPDKWQEKPTLVLLSRPYPDHMHAQMQHFNRYYVQPSAKAPVTTWDYTSPEKVQQTYDLGRKDGEAYLALWQKGTNQS